MSDPNTLRVERSRDFNTLAIVGFILAFFVAVVAVILGFVSLAQIRRTGERGRGLALAAVILGFAFTFFSIVGILAAIAIPVFLGMQSTAQDAATESDLSSAKLALLYYATDHDGQFTGSVSDLADYGYTPTVATPGLSITGALDEGHFCIEAVSRDGDVFHTTDTEGVERGPCPD